MIETLKEGYRLCLGEYSSLDSLTNDNEQAASNG